MSEDARELLSRTPLIARRGPFVLGAWPVAQASAVASGMLRARGEIRLDRHVRGAGSCAIMFEVTSATERWRPPVQPIPTVR